MPNPRFAAPATFVLLSASLACLPACLPATSPEAAKAKAAAAPPVVGEPVPASLAKVEPLARELAQALGGDKLPLCEITAVTAESKALWARRADGAWVAPKDSRPGQDVITLTVVPQSGGSFLRLDFPTDGSLPSSGPGQAGNGNAVIGEIEIEAAAKPVKAQVFSSISQSNGGREAAAAFDGVKQQGDKGWEAEGSGFETGSGKAAQLIAKLETPVAAGVPVTVRLMAKTKWGQHVPGCVSAAVVGGSQADALIAQTKALQADFDGWKTRIRTPRATLPDADARTILAEAELLRAAGEAKVFGVLQKKNGHAFLSAFVTDQAWLESFLLGGQEGTGHVDYAQALENLRLLYSQLPRETWADPVSKKLATAMSLQAGTLNRHRFVERFRMIEQARGEGKLHAGFDGLDVRAMRHAINLGGTPFEFNAWMDETQFTTGGYVGACWAVPYTDPSTYGFSIQGWGFHDPLRHAYPSPKIFRTIGGVCGTLSGFGATSGLTHGVPSFTVGQPGHCAYVVRIGDQWATGNDVFGPGSNSWSAYEGLSFTSTNALLEKTENAKEYLPAQRLLWAARAQKAAGAPAAAWGVSCKAALAAEPSNYAAWMEYVKALEETAAAAPKDAPAALSATEWLAMGRRAAEIFKEHQEAGWALASRCFQNGKAQLPIPADRAALLLEINAILSQKAVPAMYGYDIGRFLNWQADFIGDPAASVDFFGKLLVLHHSENPGLNWVFSSVMNWGNDRFAKNPATSEPYAKALGAFFAAQGDKADKGQMAGTFANGIRKASESGDMNAYRTWQALADKMLAPLTPGDVHLNPQQAAARPKIEAFPGTVLSATGLLQSSSQAGSDKPLSYGQVLGGGELGFLDTANEQKPWAQVMLAGEGELSGIVLVDRYEFAPEKPWDVPLKVEVSTDGKTWTQVALFEKEQDVYRVDLQGKALRAKFVRIERQPGPDAAKPNTGRLHMRSFLVYGRKLY